MMATYNLKVREHSDLCHFTLATEKEYGVQCIFLKDPNQQREYTALHKSVVKALQEASKDIVFVQVTGPGKAFEKFDLEKHKIIITSKAYVSLLEFFQKEWPLLQTRIETDYHDMKNKNEWKSYGPTLSFRGGADIVFKYPLDTTASYSLEFVVVKKFDSGKTNISLQYVHEQMGSCHLPPVSMMKLAQDYALLTGLCDYKEPSPSKRNRQL